MILDSSCIFESILYDYFSLISTLCVIVNIMAILFIFG